MNVQPNITPSEQPGNAAAVGGYAQVHLRDTETNANLGAARHRSARKPAPKDRGPEERAKIRDLWMKAKAAAERLWHSAKGDRSEMYVAAIDLRDRLAGLWELKAHRDANWVGILDQAQTAIDSLAKADAGIDGVSDDQCWQLLQLVDTYLSLATKTVDDLTKAVRLVSEMNLNPYSGLAPLADEMNATDD